MSVFSQMHSTRMDHGSGFTCPAVPPEKKGENEKDKEKYSLLHPAIPALRWGLLFHSHLDCMAGEGALVRHPCGVAVYHVARFHMLIRLHCGARDTRRNGYQCQQAIQVVYYMVRMDGRHGVGRCAGNRWS